MKIDWNKKEDREKFWHSTSHVMAAAVKELFPNAKFAIGPAIEEGFYYDFDVDKPFTPEDLKKIEGKMLEIAKQKQKFEKKELPKKDALEFFADEPYKIELINELQDETVSTYTNGKFTDLCKGPHLESAEPIKAIKLLKSSGAYWRGSEKNKMLQRIYGISFPDKKMLKQWLHNREEAEKRSHLKIGRDQELFLISPEVGPGLPIWLPKGTVIRDELIDFLKKELVKLGYKIVWTPHIARIELYETSGHLQNYRETMYGPMKIEEEEFQLKPMNCPHHIMVYKMKRRSYKELPMRIAEFGTVYRYEKSGELTGLVRVRGFTQDDAHIFCTPEQLKSEFKSNLDIVMMIFNTLGFKKFRARIGKKGDSDKYIGSNENWKKAEKAIEEVVKEMKLDYSAELGEAAFYGPKLDFLVKDSLGREWQLGTIQVDYNLPERFDLNYIGDDDKPHRPVMIHRAPFGSLERFLGILIEHFGGEFPLWLSPVQAKILTVADRHKKYAEKIGLEMIEAGIRIEIDASNESISYKVRKAQLEKIPLIVVVGDKEQKAKTVAVRTRKDKTQKSKKIKKFIEETKKAVQEKK
ncbi:MAG: threonine--tRNA ligase [Candidatus Diapherotrites archaeon]|nr:threonine--tRNA ligase [Candidatus Diapherotrites archaeon]